MLWYLWLIDVFFEKSVLLYQQYFWDNSDTCLDNIVLFYYTGYNNIIGD